jgi:hypothetical protein
MKKLLTFCIALMGSFLSTFAQNVVADEGAWCWFADPRALHYENPSGTINATYIGYIDVHGNVKATQYDWVNNRKTDVLIRSYFQPDDHNNPTFIVLPDERVMIFYTRHTDEPCIWYRISQKPGDITALGEEKRLATANNTTYPSPFILSDDPQHIYLCWRGINWHPTIARLTMPDANDDCHFDFGPKQIVQSTGARPYAKYQSNGKDKIFVSYTTGHPDNEMPNWLYFNVIDINNGNGPILRDLKGKQLSIINNGVFNVSKTDSYANNYPATIVDKSANIRNWVWQIALDKDEHPVIAYTHIDDAKTSHVYWHAQWNGTNWVNTWVQYAGHAFHKNWNSTEKCYSGGMALDPEDPSTLYVSLPVKDGQYAKDGVYEIWKYVVSGGQVVGGSETFITTASTKNNARPFVIPGSKNSPMRLAWMNGDYYYWIVKQGYPQGYPTAIHCDYNWQEELTQEPGGLDHLPYIALGADKSVTIGFAMNTSKYEGNLLTIDGAQPLTYALDGSSQYPVITIGDKTYKSQNRLLTSDDWATQSTGTSGDNHPTKVPTWVLTLTYDGKTLTTYRNGLVDQVIEAEGIGGEVKYENANNSQDASFNHKAVCILNDYVCLSPMTVQTRVKSAQAEIEKGLETAALEALTLPSETRTDLVLPTLILGKSISWKSNNPQVLSDNGILTALKTDTEVKLTATCGTKSRDFAVKALARDITKNLRYEQTEVLDQTSNTATGFATNKFGLAPEGLLEGLRSYTVLVNVNAKSLSGQPRIYDFGSGSGNSLFLRANGLAAGIKLNGGTTTMLSGKTALKANTDYKLAVSYDAATHTTRIYIDGVEDASGTQNQSEPYMLYEVSKETRNYIGRTQWWDGSYANDNQDFQGTISGLRLYDVQLSQKEICQLQNLPYEEKDLPTALQNGDFEGSYSVMQGSGVASDRAIYQPEGWTVDYATPNENDLTALKAGDYYFSNFFASRPAPSANSKQTYWVRQNWGTSTITLKQELRLPEGQYELAADVWKSGMGGDAIITVIPEGKAAIVAPSLENKEAWQQASLMFESDGSASTTVMLQAMHNSNGSEKIIGFDNVKLTIQTPNAINGLQEASQRGQNVIYDLQGRRVKSQTALKGVYIQNGRKVLK